MTWILKWDDNLLHCKNNSYKACVAVVFCTCVCVCVVGEECESLGDMAEQQDRAESQPNRHRANEVQAKFPQGYKLSLNPLRPKGSPFDE